MNCKKCGNQIDDGVFACPSCGEPVNGQQVNNPGYSQPQIIQVVASEKKKKPIFKRWWFWLIIIIVIIVIIASSSGGKDDSVKKENGVTEATTGIQERENVFKIGEVCNHNGLKIKYTAAEVWTGYNEYSAPDEGNVIIRFSFEIENAGDSDRTISSYSFEAYADGKATEQRFYNDILSLSLSSGRSGSGYVYFEVPADAKVIEAEYEYDWLDDSKVIFLFENNQ